MVAVLPINIHTRLTKSMVCDTWAGRAGKVSRLLHSQSTIHDVFTILAVAFQPLASSTAVGAPSPGGLLLHPSWRPGRWLPGPCTVPSTCSCGLCMMLPNTEARLVHLSGQQDVPFSSFSLYLYLRGKRGRNRRGWLWEHLSTYGKLIPFGPS